MPSYWNFAVVMPFINEGDTWGTIRNVFHCVDRRSIFDKQSAIKTEYILPQRCRHDVFSGSLEHSKFKQEAVYAPSVFIPCFQEFVGSVVNVFKKQLCIIIHNKLTFCPLRAVVNQPPRMIVLYHPWQLVYLILVVDFRHNIITRNYNWFPRPWVWHFDEKAMWIFIEPPRAYNAHWNF